MLSVKLFNAIEQILTENITESEKIVFTLFRDLLKGSDTELEMYNHHSYQFKYIKQLYDEVKENDSDSITDEGLRSYCRAISDKIRYSPKNYSVDSLNYWLIRKRRQISITDFIDGDVVFSRTVNKRSIK